MTDQPTREELLASVLLLGEGLIAPEDYQTVLDELFLEKPEEELLLTLEWTRDLRKARKLILSQSSDPSAPLDKDSFARSLFQKLQDIWTSGRFTLREFGQHTYQLWEVLPPEWRQEDPLRVLAYADDHLSWHDEQASLRIYEKLFRFYDQKQQ